MDESVRNILNEISFSIKCIFLQCILKIINLSKKKIQIYLKHCKIAKIISLWICRRMYYLFLLKPSLLIYYYMIQVSNQNRMNAKKVYI